jgi:hypothetical protein
MVSSIRVLAPLKPHPGGLVRMKTPSSLFSHDVKVEGKDLKAGTYGLFLAIEKTGPWTWIFIRTAPVGEVISTMPKKMLLEYL